MNKCFVLVEQCISHRKHKPGRCVRIFITLLQTPRAPINHLADIPWGGRSINYSACFFKSKIIDLKIRKIRMQNFRSSLIYWERKLCVAAAYGMCCWVQQSFPRVNHRRCRERRMFHGKLTGLVRIESCKMQGRWNSSCPTNFCSKLVSKFIWTLAVKNGETFSFLIESIRQPALWFASFYSLLSFCPPGSPPWEWEETFWFRLLEVGRH